MRQIILLRHGQSLWNLENRFTGWTDVDLTDRGREEARAAGEKIAAAGIRPEFFFTTYQKRAIHTRQQSESTRHDAEKDDARRNHLA